MATFLQQNLHFEPCSLSIIKKSFERVLKDVGAKKSPSPEEQSWSIGQNVIFYSARKTKTGITLVYKVYEEEAFSEEYAKKVRSLINDKVKEMFSSKSDSPENPCLRSDKIAAYTIGKDFEESSSNFRMILAVVIGGICILAGILNFAGVFSSSSSSSNALSSSSIKSTGYNFVLYQLKSPSTAVLVDYFDPNVMRESFNKIGFEMKNNQCAAMYDVEATNSFGGRVRKKYVVFFQDGEPIDLCDAEMITRNAIPTVEYVLKKKGWK